jgi:hypothetical protein
MKISLRRRHLFLLALTLGGPAAAVELSEATLRAADAEQMRIIVEGDAKAQQEFMHPNYILNGPSNRVMRKPALVTMLAQGAMGSDRFERVVEGVAITGNVGIVMGSEVVHPTPTSELGSRHGDATLSRRYTNVFLFEDGRWRFLARQATIVK